MVSTRDAIFCSQPVDVAEVEQIAVSPSGMTELFRLDSAGLVLDTYAPSGDQRGRHETGCLWSPGGFSLNVRHLTLRCAVAPGDEFYSLELFRVDRDSLGSGSR
jgi:hypothetical protein